jgi:pyruvate/2-oxoglutarate/acetoin dehydrogenase E1 component
VDNFLPLHKSVVHHNASPGSIAAGKAVTVLTYLHGTKESEDAIAVLMTEGYDCDLIELTCLKPFDVETVKASLSKTHKLAILDESTRSGGVGATVSALVSELLFDELDAPVMRLCMEDAPVTPQTINPES